MRKRFKRAITIERNYVSMSKELHAAFEELYVNYERCSCKNADEFRHNYEQCGKSIVKISELVKKEDAISEMIEVSGDLTMSF